MIRSQLGQVVAAICKAYNDVTSDPMNDYTGITPDPMPSMEEVAREHGWRNCAEVVAELALRDVSARWIYFETPLGLIEQDDVNYEVVRRSYR